MKATFLILIFIGFLSSKSQAQQPQEFDEYCADHGWFICEVSAEKLAGNSTLASVSLENMDRVDLSALNLSFKEREYQYFIISGTQKILALKPLYLLREEWTKRNVPNE